MDPHPSLPTSIRLQRVFLHTGLIQSSLALQLPWIESQPLGLALEAPITWLQSIYQVYILQPTPTPSPMRYVLPWQPSPSPRPRSAIWWSAMSMWPISNKNPRHQGSGEHPWWVIPCASCHTSLLGGLSAIHETPLGETMEAAAWSLLALPASSTWLILICILSV